MLLVLVAAVLAGCQAGRPAPGATPGTAAVAPPTTGVKSGLVDGVFLKAHRPQDGDCQPQQVLAILQELTGAIASDPALAASFAKDDFRWYSASENGNEVLRGRHAVVHDAASFRAYLERRRRQHERLRLVALQAGGDGNFVVRLVRVAGDLAPAQGGRYRVAEGKGAVNCAERSVIAFSHAMFPAEPDYGNWRYLFGDVSAKEFKAAAAAAFRAARGP